jgi:hypothetical protein
MRATTSICAAALVTWIAGGSLAGCSATNTVVPAVAESRIICSAVSDLTVAVIRNDRDLWTRGVARMRPKLAAPGLDPVLRDAGAQVLAAVDTGPDDRPLTQIGASSVRAMFTWCDANDFIGSS